jgi:menaquinone-specific isochorismate synthase
MFETQEKINLAPMIRNLQPAQQTLVSYSVPSADTPLLDFLRLGENSPRVYWETEKSPLGFAGFGIAATLTARGQNRFEEIQQQADRLFSGLRLLNQAEAPVVAAPRLVGGFAFDPAEKRAGLWSAFPAASFILPQYQLTQFEGQRWLTLNQWVESDADENQVRRQLQQKAEGLASRITAVTSPVSTAPRPLQTQSVMSHDTWCELVTDATRRIRAGELDKVVLARARQMRFDQPVDPVDVLTRLANRYPDTYRFLVEPIPGHAFYGATPELLAGVAGNKLRTVAMAGSIKRGQYAAEDDALARELMNNPKERHEHALVVDAIRENLAPLVTDLQIPDEPGLCRLSNIQHLESRIQGTLNINSSIFSVVQGLHPTPAVGGRPRAIALDIITNVEPTPRGWYAAPVGWLDPYGNGMFSVAIRSAVTVGESSMLFAGAGIVADSVPEREWRETELKFRPLAEALGGPATNGNACTKP